MHYYASEIHKYPACGAVALDLPRSYSHFEKLLFHAVGNGFHLIYVVSVGHYKIIGYNGYARNIDYSGIFALLVGNSLICSF